MIFCEFKDYDWELDQKIIKIGQFIPKTGIDYYYSDSVTAFPK